ncbi:hypothetical protein [Klebsiella michiganensis]|uniref:hypothetical protein n=1 Tax=Klebsiella michiganensis TaxID=1134687 RepID=UPI000E2A2E9C|nr:hypothetical protein [Klebsiella michiganensis]MBQ4657132.1 hypothetical protein [Klebsiella michiganensis]MBQ4663094.1 hypothetical protein [Klebsiella michiganensis]MDK3153372.1 hypothetical protein [Klebsiella michiganensis]MDV1380014.1 hypothetical protein [Klebsiella michiganensis]MDV1433989.1 hypothetical protein [Klebsiella michiganensis]
MNKVNNIYTCFFKLLGKEIIKYETAEIYFDDWEPWNDLPIRIYFDGDEVISIAWSKFDELWLSNDLTLPFSIEYNQVRWVTNSPKEISGCLNNRISSVKLGVDYLVIENNKIEVFTHLLVYTTNGILDVFNNLDENGYSLTSDFDDKTMDVV